MSKVDLLIEQLTSPLDRRKLMKRAGLAGAGLVAMSTVGGVLAHAQDSAAMSAVSDTDILNFALNLEYLEAEFYLMAAWGTNLVKLGILTESETTGPTTGGNMVNFSGSSFAYVGAGLRADEVDHVVYLRSTLGSVAVKKPAINLDALGFGFSSVDDFFKLSRQFEDTGVSAYLGAAPLISSKTYLTAAAAILATEAQHSGYVREICVSQGIVPPKLDSLDVLPTQQTPFDVDKNALSIPRSTSQVLNIVYGGGSCSGGFFPDGVNGTITCQT